MNLKDTFHQFEAGMFIVLHMHDLDIKILFLVFKKKKKEICQFLLTEYTPTIPRLRVQK